MNPNADMNPIALTGTLSSDRGIEPDALSIALASRQVVRRALFNRAFRSVTEQFPYAMRRDRRTLGRRISKDLWKNGERELPVKDNKNA